MGLKPEEKYKSIEKLELKDVEGFQSKKFKHIICPSCENGIGADNINLQNKIAKCGNCNALFSIEGEVKSVLALEEMKQDVLRPEGIDLFYFKEDLEITVQQHMQGIDAFGISLFPGIAILTFLVYFIGDKGMPLMVPSIFTIGSLFFIYRILNYAKNKTYIDINDKFLSIKSRPKNFNKDKSYHVSEIDQIYVKLAGSGMGYYTINAIINAPEGQKHQRLLTVNSLSKAKYLEQEIERYLNIEDRKILEAHA